MGKQMWIIDLYELLTAISNSHELLNDLRQNFKLDARAIYEEIDYYRMGFVSIEALQIWVACKFAY